MRASHVWCLVLAIAGTASAQSIVTIAGTGDAGDSGDGASALAARLSAPRGMVVTGNGTIFFADTGNHAVRRIGPDGVISTVAGTGQPGFAGDHGPASAALLHSPAAVALDHLGNLFVADADNNAVRRLDAASGVITTVTGDGTSGFAGDGGPASAARLAHPTGLAFDGAGNLYVADEGNHRVRVIAAADGKITTAAGNGTSAPTGDGGPATAAGLGQPNALAFDDDGNLYISDGLNHCVRRVNVAGLISLLAGNGLPGATGDGGAATAARLNDPQGVASLGGAVYIADTGNSEVRRVDLKTGTISLFAGDGVAGFSGEGAPAASAGLDGAKGIGADGNGTIYVGDSGSNRLRAVFACPDGIAAPGLLTPLDKATDVPTALPLAWDAVPGAFEYDVLLYSLKLPLRTLVSHFRGTSITASNLEPATEYSWRVIARGDAQCAPISVGQSPIQTFTTAAGCQTPAAPSLTGPDDHASTGTSPTLSWQPVPGASAYDLLFGPVNPPPLQQKGMSTTAGTEIGLVPGTTYYWSVVAHAACDATKTSASPVRSFTVSGACSAAGAFSLVSPTPGQTDVSSEVTLAWTAAANASSYDVYLGASADVADAPPLAFADLAGTNVSVPSLAAGAQYSWRVVAKSACNTALSAASLVAHFTVASGCTAPGPTSFLYAPSGSVARGQTYGLVWSAAAGLDALGAYVVERSLSPGFDPLLDSQTTSATSASFVSQSDGTVYHRVRAVAGCGAAPSGAASPPITVTVVPGAPSVVFTRPPQGVVSPLGASLEDSATSFALENVGKAPVALKLEVTFLGGSAPFFSIVDPAGGDVSNFTLQPAAPKTFEVRFSGPSNTSPGSYQGVIVVQRVSLDPLPVAPFAYVNLKVGGGESATPVFELGSEPVEYAFFPGLAGDDAGRDPITVQVRNPGTTPMELAGEVGPEVWLVPEAGWNATPIAPGSVRDVHLSTQRSLAPNGSALPRSTYFTVRTKDGKAARLLVQDDGAPALGGGRAALPRGARSYVVPSAVDATSAIGNRFVSRLKLSNAGSEPVQAELLFTPAGADGFDASAVKRAVVVVPANDVVALFDPLVHVFGLTPPVSGHLEVRAAPERIGLLTVTSNVDAAASSGGTFGFQLPTAVRGEGARLGAPHLVPGITQGAAYRTNLILAETTGLDHAAVRAVLYDANGSRLGDQVVDVPRDGQRQVSRVVGALGGGDTLAAGRLELVVESGGGSVVGLVTVIDNTNDDAVTYVSRPMTDAPEGGALARRLKPLATPGTLSLVVPSVVNGFPTFRGRDDLPYTFKSLMGFTSATLQPASFSLAYHDLQSGQTITRTLTVAPRQTIEYANALEQLFGIPAGAKSQGPVLVTATRNGTMYAKVYSNLPQGTLGDSFPVLEVPSEVLTSGGSPKPVMLDGLEQSTDITRGTRSNLILTEVGGQDVVVTVRMYEAGNRIAPIAEQQVALGPYQKTQLSTVFSGVGLETDARMKDRTNVLCVVAPVSGKGLVAAVVTTIDNKTGDTKNSPLTPAGGVTATGTPTIGF